MAQVTKEYIMENYTTLCVDKYLFMFQFTEDEIKEFINYVSMKRLAMTQKLTDEFIRPQE
jgi:hypothetical protein